VCLSRGLTRCAVCAGSFGAAYANSLWPVVNLWHWTNLRLCTWFVCWPGSGCYRQWQLSVRLEVWYVQELELARCSHETEAYSRWPLNYLFSLVLITYFDMKTAFITCRKYCLHFCVTSTAWDAAYCDRWSYIMVCLSCRCAMQKWLNGLKFCWGPINIVLDGGPNPLWHGGKGIQCSHQ